jgi:uncharacterized protein DUF4440
MRHDEVWRKEQRLWLDSVAFFEECAAPDALLVCSVGIVDRRAGLAAARRALPWSHVSLSNQRAMPMGEETTVLAYEARATRSQRGAPYVACCSSTYVRVRGSWLLIAHHRTDTAESRPWLTELGALQLFFATPETHRADHS